MHTYMHSFMRTYIHTYTYVCMYACIILASFLFFFFKVSCIHTYIHTCQYRTASFGRAWPGMRGWRSRWRRVCTAPWPICPTTSWTSRSASYTESTGPCQSGYPCKLYLCMYGGMYVCRHGLVWMLGLLNTYVHFYLLINATMHIIYIHTYIHNTICMYVCMYIVWACYWTLWEVDCWSSESRRLPRETPAPPPCRPRPPSVWIAAASYIHTYIHVFILIFYWLQYSLTYIHTYIHTYMHRRFEVWGDEASRSG